MLLEKEAVTGPAECRGVVGGQDETVRRLGGSSEGWRRQLLVKAWRVLKAKQRHRDLLWHTIDIHLRCGGEWGKNWEW